MEPNVVEVDVRFNEQDDMGVVHNSVYYIWFEVARFNFAGNVLGISYEALRKSGVLVPVVYSECKYLKPARFPDRVIIKCYYEPTEKNAIVLHYEVFSKASDEKLAYGSTVNVFTNMEGRLLLTVPEIFREELANAKHRSQYLWKSVNT